MSVAGFRRLDIQAVREALRRHAATLGARPEVHKVILFGSLAKGTYTGSSDADLLVIVDRAGEPFLLRGAPYVDPFLPIPVDLFVYTQDELNRMVASGSGLVVEALRTGEVLFERGKL